MSTKNQKTKQTFEQSYIKGAALVISTNPNQNIIDAFASFEEGRKDYEEHNKRVGR